MWAHKAVVIWHTTSHSCTFRRCGALSTSVLVYNCCSSCSRKRGSLGVVNLRAARTTLDLAPDSLQDVRADAFEERFSSASPSGKASPRSWISPRTACKTSEQMRSRTEERFSSAGTPTNSQSCPTPLDARSLRAWHSDCFLSRSALCARIRSSRSIEWRSAGSSSSSCGLVVAIGPAETGFGGEHENP